MEKCCVQGCRKNYEGGPKVRVFLDSAPERRTARKHVADAIKGTTSAPCKGVTGPCLAMTLSRFDVVDGFMSDYKHCTCIGVMRQLLKL